jgi:hypothetical protein
MAQTLIRHEQIEDVYAFRASLGSLAVLNNITYSTISGLPSLGSLAVLDQLSYTSLLNLPSLGSLAVLNDLSYTSLLNLPSLGSLAVLNSVAQEYLPSTASFNDLYLTDLTTGGLAVTSTASIRTARITNLGVSNVSVTGAINTSNLFGLNFLGVASLISTDTLGANSAFISTATIGNIYSSGIVVSTATMTQLNSGVYNLYETGVQKAIFDGAYGGRFRANASGEAFLFEYYKQLSMTNNSGQEVFKIDDVNTIFNLNNFYVNTGTLYFGNANATTVNLDTLNTNTANASTVSIGNILGNFIGLGTTITTNALTVGGTTAEYNRIAINNSNLSTGWQGYIFTTGGAYAGGYYRNNANADLGLWTQGSGSAPRVLVQNSTGRVGILTTNPLAQLHIDQSSTTANIPVVSLDQADSGEPFINYIGASSASSNLSIWGNTTAGTLSMKVRISVNGIDRWMYLYTN